MCKLFMAVLLASAAVTPAIAAQPAQNTSEAHSRQVHHGRENAAARAAPERTERRVLTNRGVQAAPAGTQTYNPQVERRVRSEKLEQRRQTVVPRMEHRQVSPYANRTTVDQHGVIQRSERRVEHRRVTGPATRVPMESRRPPVVSRTPRIGTEPPLRVERRHAHRPEWNRSWRNNPRYDWNDWRREHRPIFHMRRYRDPYGWPYQLFTIGWRLWPDYFSSSYWISDPWMYRLPPAPPGTRWIRYYNDALLVDVWTGEVIDVIHNVFW